MTSDGPEFVDWGRFHRCTCMMPPVCFDRKFPTRESKIEYMEEHFDD